MAAGPTAGVFRIADAPLRLKRLRLDTITKTKCEIFVNADAAPAPAIRQ